MTFLENFEQQCRIRGESPSHALEAAGLSKSLYGKWKKQPDRMPYGDTVKKLANYFGCSFEALESGGRPARYTSDTFTQLMNEIAKLDNRDQKHLLSYIIFTYGDGGYK